MEQLTQTTEFNEKIPSVYVVSEYQMFGYGLEHLLRQQSGDFRVVGHEHDFDKAVTQLQQVQPDIIILYSHTPLLAGARLATQLLEWQATLHLVSMSIDNNQMYVLQITRQDVNDLDGLVAAILRICNY